MYNRSVKTDSKYSRPFVKKCQKPAGRRGGGDFLTHAVE